MKKSGILLANGRRGKEDRELALGPLLIATLTGTLPQPKKQRAAKKPRLKKPETSTTPATQGGEGCFPPYRGGVFSTPLGIKKGDIKNIKPTNQPVENRGVGGVGHASHVDVKNENQEKENMDLRQSFNAIKKQADAASPPAAKKPVVDPLPPIGPQECKKPPISERAARGRVWPLICPLPAQRPIAELLRARMDDAIEKQRLAGNIDALRVKLIEIAKEQSNDYLMEKWLDKPERIKGRMTALIKFVDEFQP
jgi:hypothetical protein